MIALLSCLLLFLTPLSWTHPGSLPDVFGQVSPSEHVQSEHLQSEHLQSEQATDHSTSPQAALERLFTSPLEEDWFLPSFLEQIPPGQVQEVLTTLSNQVGAVQGVRQAGNGFEIQFSGGTVAAQLRLTPEGQIAGLFFEPPLIPIAIDEAIARLDSTPYETSLLITKDGETIAEMNAEQPLAVGSAFKLAVLAALNQQIEAGELRWDTVVTLSSGQKSLPSGIMQDWPDGSRMTLDTLATLMISVSDNTATDLLIQTIGREAIEALTERNQPFLTTKELFILKSPEHTELLRRYQNGDREARRQLLNDLGDRPLPSLSTYLGNPTALDVEWLFSSQELCTLIESVADLPAMQINPGVANPLDWPHIAFKGGSEPGVLNLTTRLVDLQGQTYCVAATWNSAEAPLNEERLTELYQRMIAGLQ
jgi:beta-lactamase class A